MKTKEELQELKKEVEALTAKLGELTQDELKEVAGGDGAWYGLDDTDGIFEPGSVIDPDWYK